MKLGVHFCQTGFGKIITCRVRTVFCQKPLGNQPSESPSLMITIDSPITNSVRYEFELEYSVNDNVQSVD